jgi:hypothetical protein
MGWGGYSYIYMYIYIIYIYIYVCMNFVLMERWSFDHVRGWLKAWARAHGRGAEVDAVVEWEQQLQLTPTEAQELEVPLDEDH